MAVIKRFFKAIGKIVTAPFMGYVWMARCKTLVKDNSRLTERNSELSEDSKSLNVSERAANTELCKSLKRIKYLNGVLDMANARTVDVQAERDAIHGYALDMDAQYGDAMAAIDQMVSICEKRSIVVQKAISGLKDAIKSLPCSNRISQKDFQRLSAAFDAIPTAYAPDMIQPVKPVTLSLDASFDVRPTQPIVQA